MHVSFALLPEKTKSTEPDQVTTSRGSDPDRCQEADLTICEPRDFACYQVLRIEKKAVRCGVVPIHELLTGAILNRRRIETRLVKSQETYLTPQLPQ